MSSKFSLHFKRSSCESTVSEVNCCPHEKWDMKQMAAARSKEWLGSYGGQCQESMDTEAVNQFNARPRTDAPFSVLSQTSRQRQDERFTYGSGSVLCSKSFVPRIERHSIHSTGMECHSEHGVHEGCKSMHFINYSQPFCRRPSLKNPASFRELDFNRGFSLE